MLEVATYTLGALDTNCYLVSEPESRRCILIDPADEGDFLSEEVLRHERILTAILLTHGHCDHVLGLLSLRLNFPDIPIFMHQADLFLIKQAQSSAQHWFRKAVDPVPLPTHYYKHDLTLELGDQVVRVIETPGHTPGSVCLYSAQAQQDQSPLIFCGDLLFESGVGRTDFGYSQPLKLEASLQEISKLPANTRCYPGHGPNFILGQRL